jgi:hypothetical protein
VRTVRRCLQQRGPAIDHPEAGTREKPPILLERVEASVTVEAMSRPPHLLIGPTPGTVPGNNAHHQTSIRSEHTPGLGQHAPRIVDETQGDHEDHRSEHSAREGKLLAGRADRRHAPRPGPHQRRCGHIHAHVHTESGSEATRAHSNLQARARRASQQGPKRTQLQVEQHLPGGRVEPGVVAIRQLLEGLLTPATTTPGIRTAHEVPPRAAPPPGECCPQPVNLPQQQAAGASRLSSRRDPPLFSRRSTAAGPTRAHMPSIHQRSSARPRDPGNRSSSPAP